MFYLTIVNKIFTHCHSCLARQYICFHVNMFIHCIKWKGGTQEQTKPLNASKGMPFFSPLFTNGFFLLNSYNK